MTWPQASFYSLFSLNIANTLHVVEMTHYAKILFPCVLGRVIHRALFWLVPAMHLPSVIGGCLLNQISGDCAIGIICFRSERWGDPPCVRGGGEYIRCGAWGCEYCEKGDRTFRNAANRSSESLTAKPKAVKVHIIWLTGNIQRKMQL